MYRRARSRSLRCSWNPSRSPVRSRPWTWGSSSEPSPPSNASRAVPSDPSPGGGKPPQPPHSRSGGPPPGTRPDVVLHLTANTFGVRDRFLMAAVTMAHFPVDHALGQQAAMSRTRPGVPPGSGRPDCPRREGWAPRRRRWPDSPGPPSPRSGRGRPGPILRRACDRGDARPFRGDRPGRVGRLRILGAPPLQRPGAGQGRGSHRAASGDGRRAEERAARSSDPGSGDRSKEAGRRRCDVYPTSGHEVRSAASTSPPGAPGRGVGPDGDRGGQPSGSPSWRPMLGVIGRSKGVSTGAACPGTTRSPSTDFRRPGLARALDGGQSIG
jgi:hypothetical protein